MHQTWLKLSVVGAVCAALLVAVKLSPFALAQEEEKAKYTIKEVMQVAHKDKLRDKVIAGDASDEEKKKLLDVYISLVENKPPKGEEDSWQTLSGKAALAAAKVVVGRDGAIAELETSTNCRACHSAHRGS